MLQTEWWEKWSPANVTLDDSVPSEAWKICVIQGVYFGESEYNGQLGARISSIFVIFVTSLFVTVLPIVARKWKIPEMCYMTAKMFGSGVIIATAFIHLMDPAYTAIGPNSCVGMTGAWTSYTWCAALIMCGAVLTFLVDIYCGVVAARNSSSTGDTQLGASSTDISALPPKPTIESHRISKERRVESYENMTSELVEAEKANENEQFETQFYGFLILEFGIILHSVMIGLSLGTTGNFETLYAAIAFHQAFEGLGIGARLSSIPFPVKKKWIAYALCVLYALTTPIAIAVGLGLQSSYRENGYASLVVSGILDSLAAGVLLYTCFVELLARDFIFVRARPTLRTLNVQIIALLTGLSVMALIGKWA